MIRGNVLGIAALLMGISLPLIPSVAADNMDCSASGVGTAMCTFWCNNYAIISMTFTSATVGGEAMAGCGGTPLHCLLVGPGSCGDTATPTYGHDHAGVCMFIGEGDITCTSIGGEETGNGCSGVAPGGCDFWCEPLYWAAGISGTGTVLAQCLGSTATCTTVVAKCQDPGPMSFFAPARCTGIGVGVYTCGSGP